MAYIFHLLTKDSQFLSVVGSAKEKKDVKGGITMTVESSVCVEW